MAEDDRLVEPGRAEQRRLALAEERDRALGALKELELDHRTGKVSDEDYREPGRPAPPPARRRRYVRSTACEQCGRGRVLKTHG